MVLYSCLYGHGQVGNRVMTKLTDKQTERLLQVVKLLARGTVWHTRPARGLYARRLSKAALVDVARTTLGSIGLQWHLDELNYSELEILQRRALFKTLKGGHYNGQSY